MELRSSRTLPGKSRSYWRVLLVLLWAAAGLALLIHRPAPTVVTGEAEKIGSGRSFAGQVTIEPLPSASTTAPDADGARLWSGEDDWEPAVAADPSSDYVYQMTTRYSGPAACRTCALPAMVFRRSADGGATWEPDRFLLPSRKPQYDPIIEVAANGMVYAVWMESFRPGVSIVRSADHGDTWTEPVSFTDPTGRPRWNDRPVLAVSADGRHVYVAFNSSDSYVVASHDFGATFARPVKTNDDGRYWFHSAAAIAPDGTAYVAVADYSQDYSGPTNIGVLRSTDGGATWATIPLDVSAEMPDCQWAAGCYFGFLGPSIGLAVDKTGAVLVAYHAGDAPGEPQRMYTRYSADGLDWTPRRALSGARLEHNGFPAVGAGLAAGDFRVAWQASYDGRPDTWNTWYRRTQNGGRRWSAPVRLSDTRTDAPYHSPDGFRFPYGDYMEIAVDGRGRNHVVWGEGISYIGPGGTWYTRGR
jgi:photosystem II stability/assembly factor-like uncharacterized protein